MSAPPNCILDYLTHGHVKPKLLKLIGVDEQEEDEDSQRKMLQEGYSTTDFEGFMDFLKDTSSCGFEMSKMCH